MRSSIYTSPNLRPGQVAQLIAELQTAMENVPPGAMSTPVCRIRVEESTGRTIVDVIPPQERP